MSSDIFFKKLFDDLNFLPESIAWLLVSVGSTLILTFTLFFKDFVDSKLDGMRVIWRDCKLAHIRVVIKNELELVSDDLLCSLSLESTSFQKQL